LKKILFLGFKKGFSQKKGLFTRALLLSVLPSFLIMLFTEGIFPACNIPTVHIPEQAFHNR